MMKKINPISNIPRYEKREKKQQPPKKKINQDRRDSNFHELLEQKLKKE